MSEAKSDKTSEQINVLDLFLIFAKNWKLILCIPFIVSLIAAIISLYLPNIYTARAMILPIEDGNGGLLNAMMSQVGGLANIAGSSLGGATKTDLYITMLNSDVIQDPVINRLGLMKIYKADLRSNAYARLDASTDIIAGKKDGTISIYVRDKDPKLAADIANVYVDELARFTSKLNKSSAGANRAFLEERLNKAKADLTTAEDDLKSFQIRNKSVDLPSQAKATLEGLAQLKAALANQEIQMAAMRRQFTDQSSEVKAVQTTIANLKVQIARMEGQSSGSLPGIGTMPFLGQQYFKLLRNFKTQEGLVEVLTKQYEMSKFNESKDLPPFQVLQLAKVPEIKTKPRRSMIVVSVGITSCIIAMLLAYLRETGFALGENDKYKLQQALTLLPFASYFNKNTVSHASAINTENEKLKFHINKGKDV